MKQAANVPGYIELYSTSMEDDANIGGRDAPCSFANNISGT